MKTNRYKKKTQLETRNTYTSHQQMTKHDQQATAIRQVHKMHQV